MKIVGSYEAKTNLSKLLDAVAEGESIMITRHGISVAMLIPVSERQKRPVKDIINDIRTYQSKHSLGGLSLKEIIEEGRR